MATGCLHSSPDRLAAVCPEKGWTLPPALPEKGVTKKAAFITPEVRKEFMRFAFFNIRSGSMTGKFWVAQSFFRIKSWFYILWFISQNKVLFNVCCNIQDAWNTGAIYLIWRITWGNIVHWYYLSFHSRYCLQIFMDGLFVYWASRKVCAETYGLNKLNPIRLWLI